MRDARAFENTLSILLIGSSCLFSGTGTRGAEISRTRTLHSHKCASLVSDISTHHQSAGPRRFQNKTTDEVQGCCETFEAHVQKVVGLSLVSHAVVRRALDAVEGLSVKLAGHEGAGDQVITKRVVVALRLGCRLYVRRCLTCCFLEVIG